MLSTRRLPQFVLVITAVCELGLLAAHLGAPTAPAAAASFPMELLIVPTDEAGRLAAGEQLYKKYCALCHGPKAKGYAADHAPSLVTSTFLATATDQYLSQAIRSGRPDTAMGGYGRYRGGPLTEVQIGAIIIWLRSIAPTDLVLLPPETTSGDAQRGDQLYAAKCQKCHGTETKRADAVHLANPGLRSTAKDSFLRYAIVHGRPGTPMVARPGKVDDTQIDDIIAFMRTWPGSPEPERAQQAMPEIPKDLPIVLNPDGERPDFTLRENLYVSGAQVKEALDKRQRIVLIDARTPGEWVDVHIPGALPLPYHDMGKADQLPKDGTWIVAYCACPHHASGAVVDELRRRGFPATAILDEGILWWKTQGFPIAGNAAAKPQVPPPTPPS